MNTFETLRGPQASSVFTKVALLLVVSILFWATGMPTFLQYSQAAALQNFTDVISDSDRGAVSDHALSATTTNALTGSDTIVMTFDPASTTAFTISGSLVVADFAGSTGVTVVGSCGGGASEATLGTSANTITLTVCAGDTVAAGPLTIDIANERITNPSVAGSYVIRMETFDDGAGTAVDSGDTRVAIIDDVVVTASVDTIFNFTVTGLATTTVVNGDATTRASTATALDFDTLTPDTPVIMGQGLSVSTNAANGFSVTIEQDQNLQSATGADIDLFQDGTPVSTPIAWAEPDGTVAFGEDGWGHFGITSEDSDLNGDEFGTQLYAGNFGSPREIFSHNGPSDGTTADSGATEVGFQIEISSLQEAGNDYTNTIFYIATPTF